MKTRTQGPCSELIKGSRTQGQSAARAILHRRRWRLPQNRVTDAEGPSEGQRRARRDLAGTVIWKKHKLIGKEGGAVTRSGDGKKAPTGSDSQLCGGRGRGVVQQGTTAHAAAGHTELLGARPGGSRHKEKHSFAFSYLHEVTDVSFLWPSGHNLRRSGHHAVHRKRYIGSASINDGGK